MKVTKVAKKPKKNLIGLYIIINLIRALFNVSITSSTVSTFVFTVEMKSTEVQTFGAPTAMPMYAKSACLFVRDLGLH